MLTVVALLTLHCRVACSPAWIVDGLAVKELIEGMLDWDTVTLVVAFLVALKLLAVSV